MPEHVTLRIQRQDGPETPSYWETFRVPYLPQMNVTTCLQQIALNPVTIEGKKTSPVAYDAACLEEVCGSCTMNINGSVCQACSTLVDALLKENPEVITLTPMTKFPVIRDLAVDRSRMFRDLKRVRAWVPVDGYYDLGPGPRVSPKVQHQLYPYSRCMTCGCCTEACPQYAKDNRFVGAFAISLTVLFNSHPTGAVLKEERLRELMGPGGISECGNAQNCLRVCPKNVPNVTGIAQGYRQVTVQWLKDLFSR
jgi:succinate dehydrogenase / fumarate reductase, iron-sulfur subunit